MEEETSTTETGEISGTSKATGETTNENASTQTHEKEKSSTGSTQGGTAQVKEATQEAKTVVVDTGAIADSVLNKIAEKYDLTPKQKEEVKQEVEEKKEPEKKEPEKKATPPSVTPASEHWKNKRIFGGRKRDAA